MRRFFFDKNRVISLNAGQRVRLVCGSSFTTTRHIHLNRGEFVIVRCAATRRIIIVSCGRVASVSRGTVHLKRGESLIVRCS